jgi:hypothetical protein
LCNDSELFKLDGLGVAGDRAATGETAFNSTGFALYLAAEVCEITRVVIIQVRLSSFAPVFPLGLLMYELS